MEQRPSLLGNFGAAIGDYVAQTRFGEAIMAPEKARLEEVFTRVTRAFLMGPFEMPPEQLVKELKELDPYLLNDMIDQLGWETIGAVGYGGDNQAERKLATQHAERLWKYSFMCQWSIWLWTSWGLGDKVRVKTVDTGIPKVAEQAKALKEAAEDGTTAQEVWNEFFEAERNAVLFADDHIQDLSDWLLLTGNQFFAFYASEFDGRTKARLIDVDQITDIITNPDDEFDPWFYKRQWTRGKDNTARILYYPDWKAFFSKEGAPTLDEKWAILVKEGVVADNAERADRKWSKNSEAAAVPDCPNCGPVAVISESPGMFGDGAIAYTCEICHYTFHRVMEAELRGDDGVLGDTGTVAVILHVAHNRKDRKSLWGWPLTLTARPWDTAHKKFVESRLAVAAGKAMYVRREQMSGGSRAVEGVRATIASQLSRTSPLDGNPPAGPGSTALQNKAVTTTELPMTTGAGDAKQDNDLFAWAAGLAYGLFPTSMGLDTARYATAVEMDKAQSMLFERYRRFWSSQFKRIVTIVLMFRAQYDNRVAPFETTEAEVTMDSFSLADFASVGKAVGSVIQQGLSPLVGSGAITKQAARGIAAELWRILMNSLGVARAEDLTNDEAFEMGDFAPELPDALVQNQVQPGQPFGQPVPTEPAMADEVIAKVLANLRAGGDSAAIAEYALGELMERVQ